MLARQFGSDSREAYSAVRLIALPLKRGNHRCKEALFYCCPVCVYVYPQRGFCLKLRLQEG
jgi:hypothetical protein